MTLRCNPEEANRTMGASCPIGAWSGDVGCYACPIYYEMLEQELDEQEQSDMDVDVDVDNND